LICHVAPDERLLLDCVKYAARTTDRPVRPLHLQALLQLPRIANADGFALVQAIESLLADLAQEMPQKEEWVVRDSGDSPRLLRFHKIDSDTVHDVLQRFHYLRSPRLDGRAYGLSTSAGHLVALCVSSPLDVDGLRQLLVSRGRPAESARVVSRVFAFEGAPTNLISHMLSKTATEERRLGATDFVTYVNPNMGFTGASYRASSWQLLGIEAGTRYRYVDGRYTTDRELAARFGPHDDAEYLEILGRRFVASIMRLEPLLVFHTRLVRSLRESRLHLKER
jgi:hypothetical protein